MVELLCYKEVKDGLQNNFGGLTLITINLQGCELARSQMEEQFDRTWLKLLWELVQIVLVEVEHLE